MPRDSGWRPTYAREDGEGGDGGGGALRPWQSSYSFCHTTGPASAVHTSALKTCFIIHKQEKHSSCLTPGPDAAAAVPAGIGVTGKGRDSASFSNAVTPWTEPARTLVLHVKQFGCNAGGNVGRPPGPRQSHAGPSSPHQALTLRIKGPHGTCTDPRRLQRDPQRPTGARTHPSVILPKQRDV